MSNLSNRFWSWYQRYFTINVSITSFLFILQLFHLYWLFTDVVLGKITGHSFFPFQENWGRFSVVFDYTEIPALITASLLYISQLREKKTFKSIFYLILVNTQWLHMLWITDEYVVDQFRGASIFHWAGILAWVAILIDFLELPVMFDTIKQSIKGWFGREQVTEPVKTDE